MSERYDLVVIGAGPGGYVAAIRAAQLGMKVACVEKRKALGGTCLNVGCIPSKAMLDSSELYAQSRAHFDEHGIEADELRLNLKKMLARKDKVVEELTGGIAFLFKKNGITHVQGKARIEKPGIVAVESEDGEQTFEAKSILLATGSEASSLPSLPFDGQHIVSSTEALCFDAVPEHLIVVGGGYIGLEMGSVWSRLGSQVTVLEFLPRLVPLSDGEMAKGLLKALKKQGMDFSLETKVTDAKVDGDKVKVKAERKGKDLEFEGDRVLVAVGRRPYTEGLGLDAVGIEPDKRGFLSVDENYQTSAEGIYAIGDLIAGPMLAHKAEEDGIACVERLAGKKTHVDYNTIPSVIYTWPELASVGLTSEQVDEQKLPHRVGRFPFKASGRAKCMGESEGLVKVIAHEKTDRVLGVHILGPRASELIAEAVTILEFSGSAEDIARICHAHPTLSESVREAALAVDGRALHVPPEKK